MNIDAIIGLSAGTAFFRAGYQSDVDFETVLDQDPNLESLIDSTKYYLNWAEVKTEVDIYDVAQAIWNLDSDEVDEIIETNNQLNTLLNDLEELTLMIKETTK
jgi:cell fate (sporulation/competence/biofilm development) regulator YlbF (YheA/YmcA/DUF963 family)